MEEIGCFVEFVNEEIRADYDRCSRTDQGCSRKVHFSRGPFGHVHFLLARGTRSIAGLGPFYLLTLSRFSRLLALYPRRFSLLFDVILFVHKEIRVRPKLEV